MPDHVAERGIGLEAAGVADRLVPRIAEQGIRQAHRGQAVADVGQRMAHAHHVAGEGVDAVGEHVGLAGLARALVVIAGPGHPVRQVVAAAELEFLVPARVVLEVGGVEVADDVVGAVVVAAVLGVEAAPGGGRDQAAPGERVVHAQRGAVELALLHRADRVVVERRVQRVQVARRIGRVRRALLRIVRQRNHANRRLRQLLEILVIPRQQHAGVVGEVPAPYRAGAEIVVAAVAPAAGGVGDPAVAAVAVAAEAQRHVVVERHVDQAVQVLPAIIARAHAHAALEMVARLVGDDRDRAGRRVAAEQGALRAFQHLDPLDVVEREQGGAGARRVDAVDVYAHGRLGADAEVVGADAAQLVTGLGRLVAADDQAGHEQAHLAQVGGGQHVDLPGGDDLQRDRHLLHLLRAALRGHRDLAELGDALGRVVRRCVAGGGILRRRIGAEREQRAAQQQQGGAAEQQPAQADREWTLTHAHSVLSPCIGSRGCGQPRTGAVC